MLKKIKTRIYAAPAVKGLIPTALKYLYINSLHESTSEFSGKHVKFIKKKYN